jgi:hypothetical protein
MESLIKELNELQATLKADGYKDWCYAQLTIDKAINVVKNCNITTVSKCVDIDHEPPCEHEFDDLHEFIVGDTKCRFCDKCNTFIQC